MYMYNERIHLYNITDKYNLGNKCQIVVKKANS